MDIYSGLVFEDFALAVITGVVAALIYDVMRILRTLFALSKKIVIVMDLSFVFIAALLNFLLCLAASYGYLRLILIIGEAIGFTIYFLTVGFVTIWAAKFLMRVINFIYEKVIQKIFSALKKTGIKFVKIIVSPFKKLFAHIKKHRSKERIGVKSEK